MLFEFPVHKEK